MTITATTKKTTIVTIATPKKDKKHHVEKFFKGIGKVPKKASRRGVSLFCLGFIVCCGLHTGLSFFVFDGILVLGYGTRAPDNTPCGKNTSYSARHT